ncbi:MAG: hypothetical protein J6V24_01830, partial [Clostridia bacterium]|nr:hypothetical protein [Clostridia bacterium]
RSPYTETAMIAGENAKTAPDGVCRMPLILDCAAARILTARGYDVGLAGCVPMDRPGSEAFPDGRVMPVDSDGRFYRLTPAAGAVPDSFYPDGSPAAYRFERPDGGPVVVYAFDFDTVAFGSAMMRNYCRQEQFFRLVPCLPVRIAKEPGAYVIARRTENRLAVGIWDFGPDTVCPEEIDLGERYSSLRPIGDAPGLSLRLSPDGDRVLSSGQIFPSGFAGFVAEK